MSTGSRHAHTFGRIYGTPNALDVPTSPSCHLTDTEQSKYHTVGCEVLQPAAEVGIHAREAAGRVAAALPLMLSRAAIAAMGGDIRHDRAVRCLRELHKGLEAAELADRICAQ
eukprot:scaffold4407_cov123-Isochrysis_galbana.AAC.10